MVFFVASYHSTVYDTILDPPSSSGAVKLQYNWSYAATDNVTFVTTVGFLPEGLTINGLPAISVTLGTSLYVGMISYG